MSIEGQGHFLSVYFPGFVCTRPRYQVSVYRTIGPLVFSLASRRTVTHKSRRLFCLFPENVCIVFLNYPSDVTDVPLFDVNVSIFHV